jgi:hypothetical protein
MAKAPYGKLPKVNATLDAVSLGKVSRVFLLGFCVLPQ